MPRIRIRIPRGTSLAVSTTAEESFSVRSLSDDLKANLGEIMVSARAVWPGEFDENTLVPEPHATDRLECSDDLMGAVRAGARSDGVGTVLQSWVDARMRGLGLGRALYALATFEARRRWRCALAADACFSYGETSQMARRAWSSLARQDGIHASGMVAWWSARRNPVVVDDVDFPIVDKSAGQELSVRVRVIRGGSSMYARAVTGMMCDDGMVLVGEHWPWPAKSSSRPLAKMRPAGGGIVLVEEPMMSHAEVMRWRDGV